ncbi:MAG: nucleotidyltransferase domain-containing protein [Flavobacteriaceae bacterium]
MIENGKKTNFSNDVLKTLLYFDAFDYPLTLDEIVLFSRFSTDEVSLVLNELVVEKTIYFINNFYAISKKTCRVERREKGNLEAKKIFGKAQHVSNFISQFPFVEGVFISGSLSKGFFGEDDDIDYFIITKPNRLWISRTLLIAYKKIFLLNSKKYFCVNYFMSTNALEVSEKNRFTATEFVTLIPMNGNGIYQNLQENNKWVLDYFPNYDKTKTSKSIERKIFKRFFEFLLNGKAGNGLEEYFMRITKNHQQKKFKKLSKSNFDIAFKGDKNTSKHHPDNHQMRVINLLNEKIVAFNRKHELDIPLE